MTALFNVNILHEGKQGQVSQIALRLLVEGSHYNDRCVIIY